MIKDKILIEKELKILKDYLKGCLGIIEELENYVEEMDFKLVDEQTQEYFKKEELY